MEGMARSGKRQGASGQVHAAQMPQPPVPMGRAVGVRPAHPFHKDRKALPLEALGLLHGLHVKIVLQRPGGLEQHPPAIAPGAPRRLLQRAAGGRAGPAPAVIVAAVGGAHLPHLGQKLQRRLFSSPAWEKPTSSARDNSSCCVMPDPLSAPFGPHFSTVFPRRKGFGPICRREHKKSQKFTIVFFPFTPGNADGKMGYPNPHPTKGA